MTASTTGAEPFGRDMPDGVFHNCSQTMEVDEGPMTASDGKLEIPHHAGVVCAAENSIIANALPRRSRRTAAVCSRSTLAEPRRLCRV